MDKPGSADHAAFTEMVRLAEKKNLVFHVGYMYRYNPAVEYAREVVKSGKLGTVYSVEAQMNGLHSAEKRQWMDSFPGGMQFFLGCHLIDLIVQLQGIPSEIIPCNKETGFDGVTATDFGMTVFKYPNGVSFAKACDAEPGGFARRQLVICGEKGTLEIRPMEKYIVPAPDEKNMYTAIREVYYDKAAKLGWNYDGEYRQLDPFNRYHLFESSLRRNDPLGLHLSAGLRPASEPGCRQLQGSSRNGTEAGRFHAAERWLKTRIERCGPARCRVEHASRRE